MFSTSYDLKNYKFGESESRKMVERLIDATDFLRAGVGALCSWM